MLVKKENKESVSSNPVLEMKDSCRSSVKLGCYYFNNWVSPEVWSSIKYFKEENLEPILGYYRDDSVEVQEWHIRQATQHGISFWVFDWYYDVASRTVPYGDAALDNGFLNTGNCNDMEFAIMWCNEEKDISGWTEEALLDMTHIICERYLTKSNYLKTPDGRNYFEITRPDRSDQSVGLQGTNTILRKMNEAAAEYGGFYYVAIKYPTDADATELKAAGFDALTLYSYNNDGAPKGAMSAPYETILPAVEPIIRTGVKSGILPVIPCVSPNWDSRPWAGLGGRGSWRTGSTPELFADMCVALQKYTDPGLNMMLIGTWNEFGEGSHIEPTVAKGCKYLDAMQKALFPDSYTEHEALIPTEEEKVRMDYNDIPPVNPEKEQDGNLVINPSFERDYGWGIFGIGEMQYSEDCVDGKRSFVLPPVQMGVKSKYLIEVELHAVYNLSVWVKGKAEMQCALFDKDRMWLKKKYEKFDECAQNRDDGRWVQLKGKFVNTEEDVVFIDIEIKNTGEADVLVDLAEVRRFESGI